MSDGAVEERSFVLALDHGDVPGVLWRPARASGPLSLVLGGHGFGLDHRFPFPLETVRGFAAAHGCAVAVLDARASCSSGCGAR